MGKKTLAIDSYRPASREYLKALESNSAVAVGTPSTRAFLYKLARPIGLFLGSSEAREFSIEISEIGTPA